MTSPFPHFRLPSTRASIGVLVAAALTMALKLLPSTPSWADVWSGVGLMAVACTVLLLRGRNAPQRASWWLMAAGVATNMTGDVVWIMMEQIQDQSFEVTPFACEVLYLASYPLFMLAVWRAIDASGRREALRSAPEVAGFLAMAGLASWQFLVVLPGLPEDGAFTRIAVAAYPLLDAALLSLALWLALLPRAERAVSRAVLAFSLVFMGADLYEGAIGLAGVEDVYDLHDATFAASFGVLALAATLPHRRAGQAYVPHEAWRGAAARAVMIAAALAATPTIVVMSWHLRLSTPMWLLISAGIAVTVTMMLRLVVMAHALERAHITARQAEQAMQHQAHHDALTGLPNRRLLEDRLSVALARAPREDGSVAVMFLDLDRFKYINDTHGHAAGDAVLVEAAERIRQAVRVGDTVARMGGDEFVVVLPDVPAPGSARRVANDVLRRLHEPFLVDGHSLQAGASVGLALAGDGAGAHDVLVRADAALSHAKRSGRGQVMVAPDEPVVPGPR